MNQQPTSTSSSLRNLYDIPPASFEETVGAVVTPPFRVRQIQQWIYDRGVSSFDEMTNLPKELRLQLAEHFTIDAPVVRDRTTPAADGSQKYLFTLADGSLIESVYMPMGERTSLCLSSQAGCAVGCTFCVTGFFGAGRNLLPSEILGQFNVLRREKQLEPEHTNIVFMGMGEPLLNLENVMASLAVLNRHIAPKRITISTAGIIPGIRDLARVEHPPNLAVSINAPDQKRREEIMPITKKYPLDELIDALARFPVEKGREITAEYVLLAGYNDSVGDARALSKLLRPVRCKVNVIPFNPDPNLPDWMKRPDDRAIDRFAGSLVDNGTRVTVRRSKGTEIAAACGQLRGKSEPRRRPVRSR